MPGRVAFQYPNFRYYMTARFLATAASEMQAVAVGWQVYSISHRPLDLGLAGLAQFLPGMLLFLVAGHAADRFPRRRIIMACFAGFSLCSLALLALTVMAIHSTWPIYAVLLGNGVVRYFNGPAGQSFLPSLVTEEHFPNAVAWSASIFMSATIMGPAIGGLLYGFTASPAPVYGSAAVGALTSLALLSKIRVKLPVWPRTAATAGMVLDGLRYIWRKKLVLGAMSLDLFAVLLGGAVALLPVYAAEILKNRRPIGPGIASQRTGDGRASGRRGDSIPAAQTQSRRGDAVVRGRFRRVHRSLRTFTQCSPFHGGAGADGRVRYGERDCTPDHGSTGHPRRNARPRERREYGFHRRIERTRPVRIRHHGAVVWNGPRSGLGRPGHNRHRGFVGVDVPRRSCVAWMNSPKAEMRQPSLRKSGRSNDGIYYPALFNDRFTAAGLKGMMSG